MIAPRRAGKGRQVMAEINITPFTDVVLVLLIIFMVSASYIGSQNALNVNLPSARNAEAMKNRQNVEVTIKADENIYVDGNPFSPQNVTNELMARNQKKPIDTVIVRADKGVNYERVVRVFDAVKQAGIENIALPTKISTAARR